MCSSINIVILLPLHKTILDAVLARNAPAAVKAMTLHLDDTKRRPDLQGRCLPAVPLAKNPAARPPRAARTSR